MTMSLSVERPIVAEPARLVHRPGAGRQQRLKHLRRQVGHRRLARLGGAGRHLRLRCLSRAHVPHPGHLRVRLEIGRRRRSGPRWGPALRIRRLPGRAGMRSRRWWPGPRGGAPGRRRGSGDRGPGLTGRLRPGPRGPGGRGDGHRRGLGRAPSHPTVPPDLEPQRRPIGIADVDARAVLDVDHRHPPAVDEGPVERTVVDRQPPALIEPQQQMGARNQRVGDAHVGPEVTPDHHVVARRESPFRPVIPNGQRRWGWRSHCTNFNVGCYQRAVSGAPVTTHRVRL